MSNVIAETPDILCHEPHTRWVKPRVAHRSLTTHTRLIIVTKICQGLCLVYDVPLKDCSRGWHISNSKILWSHLSTSTVNLKSIRSLSQRQPVILPFSTGEMWRLAPTAAVESDRQRCHIEVRCISLACTNVFAASSDNKCAISWLSWQYRRTTESNDVIRHH